MHNILRFFSGLGLSVLIIAGIVGLVLWQLRGVRFYSVHTNDLAPAVMEGDLLVDAKATPNSLVPGDIVSYYDQANPGSVISSKIEFINDQDQIFFESGKPISATSVLGKEINIIPSAGSVLDELKKPLVLAGAIYLPATWILLAELNRLKNQYNYKPYQYLR